MYYLEDFSVFERPNKKRKQTTRLVNEKAPFQNLSGYGMKKNMDMGSDGARNKKK
jgi:hypothetical protein